jgi:hypothetical protein
MRSPAQRANPLSKFSAIRWRLVGAMVAGTFLVAVYAFQWSIIDRITPFLYLPVLSAAWVIAAGAAAAALTCVTKITTLGLRAFVPAAVIGFSVLLVSFTPFTYLWLEVDYWRYQQERREIVERILAGDLVSNVEHNASLIALPGKYPLVSMGGNEVVVERHGGEMYILFFTYRGILDNYSGFLYVTNGGSPSLFSDLSEEQFTQIVPQEQDWYFISHR